MIYSFNNFTLDKIENLSEELSTSLNSDSMQTDVFLTDKEFIDSPLYNELNRYLPANSYYFVSIKFPTVPFANVCKLISYIYLYLYGKKCHIDSYVFFEDFPWNMVYYDNKTPASAYKYIERKYISALLLAIPDKIIDDNRYMTRLDYDRIKARITGALYDAKIYKEHNSTDDTIVQSSMSLLL